MADKNCKKCSWKSIKKDWFKRGKQRYKCKDCWYVFQNKSRDRKNEVLWNDYSRWKQTYKQVWERHLINEKTVRRRLDKVSIKKTYKTTENSNTYGYNILLTRLLSYGV